MRCKTCLRKITAINFLFLIKECYYCEKARMVIVLQQEEEEQKRKEREILKSIKMIKEADEK